MFKHKAKCVTLLFASKLSGLSLGLLNVAIVVPQVRIHLFHFQHQIYIYIYIYIYMGW